MDDFEFDTDLLISLVEARPVLWDKTYDIYKGRNETKNAWREVCICIQEDFRPLGDSEVCHTRCVFELYGEVNSVKNTTVNMAKRDVY